ncbi:MAG TPA: YhjD/YihY/BrkB family envelope integrity protein [bacterium]|mgnify:CR=1 FL=1|nr:YhjD/YihY/BrkB family envelope integrity protein [bacterium]HPR89063.1 YhjD/YihY/BrkB family envelope integrity protein [bacterium]
MSRWNQIKEKLAYWRTGIHNTLKHDPRPPISRARFFIQHHLLLGQLVMRSFLKDKLFDTAGALVYTTLLALVPFIAVFFSLMKGIGMQETISRTLTYAFHPLGENAVHLLVPQIMSFVNNTNINTLGYIGFFLLLGSLLLIVSTIEYSFNTIWRVKKQRKMYRRFVEYTIFIIVGPIIGLLILSWIANRFQLWIDSPPTTSFISAMLRNVGPWLITIFIFWYLLNFIPNTRVRFRSAVIASLTGTGLWMMANWFFARFLDTLYFEGAQAAMYARFAVLPLLLLWLFIGWSILLFSSQLAYAHQNMDKLVWDRTHPYLSPMFYESLALKLLLRITYQYFSHGKSSTEEELSDFFSIPESVINTVASELVNLELLHCQNGGETRYIPAKHPAQIQVAEAMIELRNFDTASRRHSGVDHLVRQVMGHADSSMKSSWKNMTIQDLLDMLPQE